MLKQGILFFSFFGFLFASNWDYEVNGPKKWGTLDPNWKLCATGQSQSPINIISTETTKVKNTLFFDYKNNSQNIQNNGHTLQVNFKDSGFASIENKNFQLVQFHFHTPSETHINDKTYPLEIHFVHQNEKKELLVISVLMEEGDFHPEFEKIVRVMPNNVDSVVEFKNFEASALLPKSKAYYEFMGSLTTPPCSENVTWVVFKQPIQASKEQIQKVHNIIHDDARNIQPTNHRLIKEAD